MNFKNLKSFFYILILFQSHLVNGQFGSLGKWVKNEVVPTITGERPLDIDPNRVTINHGGEKIFEVTSEGNGTMYLDMGVAKLQTTNLMKRVAQAAAIYSGNTAVISEVMYEQLEKQYPKEITKLQQSGAISNKPPTNQITQSGNKEVTIYNSTGVTVKYVMNDEFYVLANDAGRVHSGNQFFFQLHYDPYDESKIYRLYLTGEAYGLYSTDGKTFKYFRYEGD